MYKLIVTVLFIISFSLIAKEKEEKFEECLSTREFITVVGFLNEQKQFKLKDADLVSIANSVAAGCTGAAGRFISVSKMLIESGIDSNTSLKIAKRFAEKETKYAETFIALFKQSYLQKYLDLSAGDALKLALKLTIDIDGSIESVMDDFGHLALFCTQKDLNLPYQTCSELAGRISVYGAKYEKRIGESFTNLYYFLVDSSGPSLPTFKALEVAESTMKNGPAAYTNFTKAYAYAISGDAPAAVGKDPVSFSLQMANLSSKKKELE